MVIIAEVIKPELDLEGQSGCLTYYTFGPFRLFPSERRLTRDDNVVPIGSRALDILIVLIESPGIVITKDKLVSAVWCGINVEESSLRVHIAKLRKALGEGEDDARYIANITGRGYSFVAQVQQRSTIAPIVVEVGKSHEFGELAQRNSLVIGRDAETEVLCEILRNHRLVTVHGTGGIGKTTLAIEVANFLAETHRDGLHLLDLGAYSNSDSVADVLAASLGLAVQFGSASDNVMNYLAAKEMLLVLDCCEHVIDQVASLVEPMSHRAPTVTVLCTSRELLRVGGEFVFSLDPLKVPLETESVNAQSVWHYASAELLLRRVISSGYRQAITDEDAAVVADICRKVNGIPLALEFTAGRIPGHGFSATSSLLNRGLSLTWQGRRTALPRHQTLTATLDWSYDLLADQEKAVLARLSVFVGAFGLEEAQIIAADDDIPSRAIPSLIDQLIAKSLLAVEPFEHTTYRLLDTTRIYARYRLEADAEEASRASRKHATYYRNSLSDRPCGMCRDAKSNTCKGERAANVRAALEWAFGPHGDPSLGVELTTGALELFLELSLFHDLRQWSAFALSELDDSQGGGATEMRLRLALGQSALISDGGNVDVGGELKRALEIATAIGDQSYEFRILCGLHRYHRKRGHLLCLLPQAKRANTLSLQIDDRIAKAAARSMLGVAHHLNGNLDAARDLLTKAVGELNGHYRTNKRYFGLDHDGAIFAPMTLWQAGFPDRAREAASELADLDFIDPFLACGALLVVNIVNHLTGENELVATHSDRMIRRAKEHSLAPFEAVGRCFWGNVIYQRGDRQTGVQLLTSAVEDLHSSGYLYYSVLMECIFAKMLRESGIIPPVFTEDLSREQTEADGIYISPEYYRVRGIASWQAGDHRQAEIELTTAIDRAHSQGALSWQLRSATDLALLLGQIGKPSDGRRVLSTAYAAFSEGFDTVDLLAAREALKLLGGWPSGSQ